MARRWPILPQGWEGEFCLAVGHQKDLALAESILTREVVRNEGNLSRKEWHCFSPWYAAIMYKAHQLIRLMVSLGVDIDSFIVNEEGHKCTGLGYAVFRNDVRTVRLLLELGADLRVESRQGHHLSSPMYWAERLRYDEVRRVLQEHADLIPYQQTLKHFLAKESKTKELNEAVAIQQRLTPKTQSITQINAQISALKKKEQNLAAATAAPTGQSGRIRNRIAHKVMEMEAIGRRIKELEYTRDETNAEIASLKTMPGYRTELQIDQLTKHLQEIETLGISLKEILHPNSNLHMLTCSVCYMVPQQVFSCIECHNWFCNVCRGKLKTCPNCRESFRTKVPLRNITAEQVLHSL